MSSPKLNPALVNAWSEKLSKEEPFEYPFKAIYIHKNKKLIYIASLHTSAVSSPTFKMIEDTFKKNKFDFVILEGINYSLGKSPKKLIDWANKQDLDGKYIGFETAYSIVQANNNGIPFIGGEADETFVHSQVIQAGYNTKDFLFYQFLQQVFQAQESGAEKVNSTDLFNRFIELKRKKLNPKEIVTYDSFKTWYLDKMKTAFKPKKKIAPEMLAPYENENIFTQQVSAAINKVRDQFVLNTLNAILKDYNSILVIQGGSHWSTQKQALENALGKPSFEKH